MVFFNRCYIDLLNVQFFFFYNIYGSEIDPT